MRSSRACASGASRSTLRPALEEEVTLALEARRRELEETQGHLEARRTEWVRDRQEAETKLQALRVQYVDMRQQRERLVSRRGGGSMPDVCATAGRSPP